MDKYIVVYPFHGILHNNKKKHDNSPWGFYTARGNFFPDCLLKDVCMKNSLGEQR